MGLGEKKSGGEEVTNEKYEELLAEIGEESQLVQEISSEYELYVDTYSESGGEMQSWEQYFVEAVGHQQSYGLVDVEAVLAQRCEWVVSSGSESGPGIGVAVDEGDLGLFLRSMYRASAAGALDGAVTLTFRLSTPADQGLPGFR
jgi:hypothetical protein